MTRLTGKLAWTGLDGRDVPKITHTSKDYGGTNENLEMKELDASNLESAAQRLNPAMPISLQPAQMHNGNIHWMGELLQI